MANPILSSISPKTDTSMNLIRAHALTKIAAELVSPCGDLATGKEILEEIGLDSLHTTLCMVLDLLRDCTLSFDHEAPCAAEAAHV